MDRYTTEIVIDKVIIDICHLIVYFGFCVIFTITSTLFHRLFCDYIYLEPHNSLWKITFVVLCKWSSTTMFSTTFTALWK